MWGYYSQHVFEMWDGSGAFNTRERGMYGIHWINTTGGDLDTTWTTADFTAVEAAQAAFWAAQASRISNGCRLVEPRWYKYGPNINPPNPPTRITTLATPLVGTHSSAFPHQIACTATIRTPIRRHWGRIYLPLGSASVTGSGQLSPGTHALIAADVKNMLVTGPGAQGIVPVVYDRNRKSALGMTELEVDSVLDVIRRRRPRTGTTRTVLTS